MSSFDHLTGTFIGKGGIEIFFQKWLAQKTKHIIIIVHGLGEHSGRYDNLINHFDNSQVSFYALDHRGFGNSGGKRGHVDEFIDYVYDLKLFLDFAKQEFPSATITMLGHSMGGVIAGKYALLYPNDIDHLILSSPGLEPTVEIPGWKSFLAEKLSAYAPTFTMPNGLDPTSISRDTQAVEAYINDPLVHDKVSARWYTEYEKSRKEILIRCYEFKMPLFLLHGNADKLVSFLGTERVYENASSSKKHLLIVDGGYHESFNEIETDRNMVLEELEKWFYQQAGKKTSKKGDDKEKSTKKKSTSKKSGKKAAVKKTAKKKTTAKKTGTKAAQKKSTTKKAAPKKSTTKKSTAKKAAPKKSTTKKATAKKATPKKKPTTKKK